MYLNPKDNTIHELSINLGLGEYQTQPYVGSFDPAEEFCI